MFLRIRCDGAYLLNQDRLKILWCTRQSVHRVINKLRHLFKRYQASGRSGFCKFLQELAGCLLGVHMVVPFLERRKATNEPTEGGIVLVCSPLKHEHGKTCSQFPKVVLFI